MHRCGKQLQQCKDLVWNMKLQEEYEELNICVNALHLEIGRCAHHEYTEYINTRAMTSNMPKQMGCSCQTISANAQPAARITLTTRTPVVVRAALRHTVHITARTAEMM